jgi:tyrosyl-tRNA synthetase
MADQNQLDHLTAGSLHLFSREELANRLAEGRPLRIKAGFDPTAPDLHLGHLVLLRKLRAFQDAGHQVIIVVGDFTATIGDPTGRTVLRKPLSPGEVDANALTYERQLFRVLDKERTRVVRNSTWLRPLPAAGLIELAAEHTVARMLERDDFEARFRHGHPIALHEFLYPVLQGYDSVVLEADVELGGSDQLFNLLMGRRMQAHRGQTPQIVLTMPLLVGLDGSQKMSKSLGNHVALEDSPQEIYGKIMSIPDALMWDYLTLLTDHDQAMLTSWRRHVEAGANPRDIKMQLAFAVVAMLHDEQAAMGAQETFVAVVQKRQLPEDMPIIEITCESAAMPLPQALKQAGLVASTSEAMRLIKQGGVHLDGERVAVATYALLPPCEHIVQVGKRRFAKLCIKTLDKGFEDRQNDPP